MENIEKVWQTYSNTRDPQLKETLILEYAHIVKYVAGRISMHIGGHVEYEDLVSYGIFGLIDAIDKFDYVKGVKFETYASLRIRGSIIDSIRKMDWVPRTLRKKNKLLEQAYTDLEHSFGREPTEEELANKLNIPIDEVKDYLRKSSVASLISLDDYMEQNHETNFAGSGSKNESPEALYETTELKNILVEAISKLTEKEKNVVTLYYFEDLTLKEISNIMNVSESRISQIHSKAILKLQGKLGKHKYLLFNS